MKKFKKKGKLLTNKNEDSKQCPPKSHDKSKKEIEGTSTKTADNGRESKGQELDVVDNGSNTSGSSVSSSK